MEKKAVRAMAAIIFGTVLTVSAMRGSHTESEEFVRLQNSMRNLKRVNNLQMTYSYTVEKKGMSTSEQVDVWADMLSGSWVSEHYTTDEDGTRLYLRQYCDGRTIYHYIEWTGEWEAAENVSVTNSGNTVPNLDNLTVLDFDEGDIVVSENEKTEEEESIVYTFTPEYLQEEVDKNVAEMEKMYLSYQKSGMSEEDIQTAELNVEQYKNMVYEDAAVTYTINASEVLETMKSTATLLMPEITKDETGQLILGENQEVKISIVADVIIYDQDGILNKIEACKNEVYYN